MSRATSALESRHQAAVLDVLEVEPPHDLGAVGRPVEFIVPAGLVNVAGLRAGPVVLFDEKLLQPGEEFPDQLAFLLLALRLGDIDSAGVIERAFVLLARFLGEGLPVAVLGRGVERGRQRHQFFVGKMDQRLPVLPGHVIDFYALAHFCCPPAVGLVVAMSAHDFVPLAAMWGADQCGLYVRYSANFFCSSAALVIGRSSQRTEW